MSYALNAKAGYRDGDADTNYVTAFHQTQDPIHEENATPAQGRTSIGMGVAHSLTSAGADASEDGTGRGTPLTSTGASVRRLTPTECERLQALPDGWTDHGPDSRRYAAIGDAVTSSVAEWIGRRLMAVAA